MRHSVQLPPQRKPPAKGKSSFGTASAGAGPSSISAPVPSSNTPKQFLCAINGHVMKDPVRSKYGHSFEKVGPIRMLVNSLVEPSIILSQATIELWRQQQGRVCPLTGQQLGDDDIEPDKELKLQIEQVRVQVIYRAIVDRPVF
jgi:hypothetical protein